MIRSLLIALLFVSFAAQAQFRTLPTDAKRATMVPVGHNLVEMDGKRMELSAGAQVRDARNMIILPAMLPPSSLVKYQLGLDGKLQRIWMLSRQEVEQPDAPTK
jgi:hypothetical protein